VSALFESGRIIDLILALMVVEAVVFFVIAKCKAGRVPFGGLVLNLAAGASLLLALRAVLTGADWRIIGIWLGLAFIAHLADLGFRFACLDR